VQSIGSPEAERWLVIWPPTTRAVAWPVDPWKRRTEPEGSSAVQGMASGPNAGGPLPGDAAQNGESSSRF